MENNLINELGLDPNCHSEIQLGERKVIMKHLTVEEWMRIEDDATTWLDSGEIRTDMYTIVKGVLRNLVPNIGENILRGLCGIQDNMILESNGFSITLNNFTIKSLCDFMSNQMIALSNGIKPNNAEILKLLISHSDKTMSDIPTPAIGKALIHAFEEKVSAKPIVVLWDTFRESFDEE